jgi:hypothetical protein
MDDRTDVPSRLDLHNISIDFTAASAGLCGFTHLDSGRICELPHRHHGPCQLPDPPRQMSRFCTPCQYLAESGRSNSVHSGQTRSGSGIR